MEAKRCQLRALHSTRSSCGCRSNLSSLKGEKKKQQPKCFRRCPVGTVFISEAQSHKSQICLQGPCSLYAVVKSGCVLQMFPSHSLKDCAHRRDWTHSYTTLKCAQSQKQTVNSCHIIWSLTSRVKYFIVFLQFFSDTFKCIVWYKAVMPLIGLIFT